MSSVSPNMKVLDVLKKAEILDANFQNIISVPNPALSCEIGVKSRVFGMPTTHTFGYEKSFDIVPGVRFTVYPYKNILFEHKALHSESYREKLDPATKTSLKRTMTAARAYGLNEFVFSYLGTHEYYYAESNGEKPAFGVFLSPSLDFDDEKFPNATLFDLESRYINGRLPQQVTLHTGNARDVSAHEIANFYENDFFNYWVCKDYALKNYHDIGMWEQKREFHYFEKIGIEYFQGIIWPLEMVHDEKTGKANINTDTLHEIALFGKQHPDIIIYPYQWEVGLGKERFSFASFFVINFLYLHGVLPTKDTFLQAYDEKFY